MDREKRLTRKNFLSVMNSSQLDLTFFSSASLVASAPFQPQQLKEDVDIVDFLKQFRSEVSSAESLSTTFTPSEVTEEVKIRTRRDTSLTIRLLQDSTSNLQNRSVCPWTYRVQTDSNRQPADLVEAVCSTSGVQGSANVCEPVFYYVPIKTKQTSPTGVVTWADDYVKWSVGCTFAQPKTQPALPPTEEPTLS